MPTSAPPSPVTEHLASWVAGLSVADVPPEVRERAKHLLLDGIGCALIGAGLEWSRSATDAVCALEGRGPAVLIGTGRTSSPSAAALLNSSYIQGFELDDYHPAAPIPGVSAAISDQDEVVLDVRAATIQRVADGTKLTGSPLPDFVLEIAAQGGLLPKLVADGYIPTDPTQIHGSPAAAGRPEA